MGKQQKKKKAMKSQPFRQHQKQLFTCSAVILLVMAACLFAGFFGWISKDRAAFRKKLALLEKCVVTEETEAALGKSPAGGQAGQAVLISVCNTGERARVFCGTGRDLPSAWKNAARQVQEFLKGGNYDPVWVKADVVESSDLLQTEELVREVKRARHEFYRYGIAFDPNFQTALLEAELNGAKIYDYENGGIDKNALNSYLKKEGRDALEELPEIYTVFRCRGWFCDEDNQIFPLSTDDLDYGRRMESVDAEYARELIMNASEFLVDQIQEDGSFVYGIYPRFDNEIDNYNMVRHASTLWSLICRYRLEPEEELAEKIERSIRYMLDHVIYDSDGRAWLYEEKDEEIKLGGCGVAVVALTEYMDVFQNEKYKEVCLALGEGILLMTDPISGEYYHVLSRDFTRKEKFRTVYYDGEATFALCRLYSLTGEEIWLNAARSAVDHFIKEDYSRYKDHWVAYSMNEITKHITDNKDYYAFALKNAQVNLEEIRERDTTYHTYLELLMATFEVYDRMVENGLDVGDFDLQGLLETIAVRVNRQLNGYFYPEYAMYMKNPRRILNTFMVRHDGYRVRIDDVQHNIGGYYLYFKNYDKLIACGLPQK